MENIEYWEHRLHNLEENILVETDPKLLKLDLVNYVELLIHIALSSEVERYTYLLN